MSGARSSSRSIARAGARRSRTTPSSARSISRPTPSSKRLRERGRGHRLALGRYHAMRLLLDGVLAGVNPVSARFVALEDAPKRLPQAAT